MLIDWRRWKKLIRYSLFGMMGLVALLALMHAIENWRGKRAWEQWKAQRLAFGDSFDSPIPPAVSDADNFAAAPRVAAACLPSKGTPMLGDFSFGKEELKLASWREGQREDLGAWAASLKASDIPTALAPIAKALEELSEASRRPACRMPVNYAAGEIPSLLGFRAVGRALRLRALASLRAGKPETAREDTLTILRIARHASSDSTFLGGLLQMALVELAMQPIWEGLVDHTWRESDLILLQEELGKQDVLSTLSKAFHNERLYHSDKNKPSLGGLVERSSWEGAKGLTAAIWTPSIPQTFAFWAFIPKGWVYQNMLYLDRLWAEQIEPCTDPKQHRYFPGRIEPAGKALDAFVVKGSRRPYQFLAGIMIPALLKQHTQAASRQVALDEAQVACALERFRLARKAYPENLGELIQVGLIKEVPVDVPAGGPLHYTPIGRDGYVLYSVGSNGKDEGGRVATRRDDFSTGDWAWGIPGQVH